MKINLTTIIILFLIVYIQTIYSKDLKLLNTVFGEVGSGNYTYYSLMYEGPITLNLISENGDADLYISQLTNRPTFEHESYCLHSATCGLDVINIPPSFTRPIGIGIYGHPSNELSIFVLEVYQRDKIYDSELLYEYIDFNEEEQQYVINDGRNSEDEKPHWSKSNDSENEEPESFLWTVIISVLEIFLEIFFISTLN